MSWRRVSIRQSMLSPIRQSMVSVREVLRPETFYIVTPELARVGEGGQAYFQRFLVATIGIACISIDFYNWYGDCRLVQYHFYDHETPTSSVVSNFTTVIDSTLSAFGFESYARTELVESCGDCEYSYFSISRQSPVYDVGGENHYECQTWDVAEGMDVFWMGQTEAYWRFVIAIHYLAKYAPYVGMVGVFCAMVETFCIVFYPSIIAGAVFLAGAGALDSAWLMLFTINNRRCLSEHRCVYAFDFYTHLAAIVGYCFAGCLLVFGLRAYPWCLRKNRDPKNCPVVEPEILAEEDCEERELRPRRAVVAFQELVDVCGSSNEAPRTMAAACDSDEEVLFETCVQLETELNETQEKLDDVQEKLDEAMARAEKAEAMLLQLRRRSRSSLGNLPETSGEEGEEKKEDALVGDNTGRLESNIHQPEE